MATCALIYPISRVILFLPLLFKPVHAGSYAPNTERSRFTDSTELPVNSLPGLAQSTSWEEVSVPDGHRRTHSPGTDSLFTSGRDPSDRHQSPSEPNGGPRTRELPNSSIMSESWIQDSENNIAYISTTRELELQMSTNSTVLEKSEMSTSFAPVTKNSQSYLPTMTSSSESKKNIVSDSESSNLFISASDYISENLVDSESLSFASTLETLSEDGKVRRWFHGTASAGTGNLKRSLNTSPDVSEGASNIGLNDVTVPLNTVSNGTSRSLSGEQSNSERSSSISSTDSKMLSTLPSVSDRSLNNGIRASPIEFEGLSSSQKDFKRLLNNLSNNFEERSTLTDIKRSLSTIPNDSERSNSITEFKRSLSTSPNNLERLSSSLYDLKQSLSTRLNDPERLSTSLDYFRQPLSSSATDPERLSSSLDGFKRSLSTSPNNVERLRTALNHFKHSLTISPTDPEKLSTSWNDFKRSVSTSPNDFESLSTSLNDFKQSLTSSPADPESLSTSLNDFKQSLSSSSIDPERLSTSLNDFKRSLSSSSIDPERLSTSLNDFKRSLSTSPNYFERLSTSLNDFERINTSLNDFKQSLSSSSTDPERLSTSLDGIKQTLINTPNNPERLSTSQNNFKRSLSSSPIDPDRLSVTLTDFKRSERSSSASTNVFESSSSASSNTSLNISETAFTRAQDDSERSLGTSTNGFESSSNSSNDSELFSTLQNVSEKTLSNPQNNSKGSLSTSSNDSKRSISSSPNDVERSLNTSPNNIEWSLNISVNDSVMFLNTSANDTARLSVLPNVSEEFSINTQYNSERFPNMSKDSVNDAQVDSERSSRTSGNYFESSSNTSPNNSGRALSTSSNVFERSLPNTSVSSPSTLMNSSNISVNSTLNNSGYPLNTSLNNPKRSLDTATNSTDGTTPLSTSIPMDLNDVTNGSDEEGSFDISSIQPTDTYTNGSSLTSFISRAETMTTITATSHLLPRITDNFLNTTLLSTIYNITKFITTTLSSIQSDSQGLMNNSRELNYDFTTANSSEPDLVESITNSVDNTHVARTTPGITLKSELPERRSDSPKITIPKTTHAHVSLSTIESFKEEAVSTSSTPVVITSRSNTGSYTMTSQVSTDIPKPTLSNVTGNEFATVWTSPALLTSPLTRDKTTAITIPTISVIKTTKPSKTRTSATISTLTSTKTSTTTKTSTISSIQTSTMIPTSTRTSDISTDIPTTAIATVPSTVPPTTIGRLTPEPSTMIQVTTRSISEVSTENACISSPCLNGGTCINYRNNRRKCLCPPSWQGVNCSKDVDECLSNPCPSRAKCVNNLGSFSCKCHPGYYFEKGTRCTLARTFAGVLYIDNKSRISELKELEGDILKILNASLFLLNGYYTSVVTDLSEADAGISVLNMFILSST
ncbi:serine-rich adhesin for platelets-like [Pristis pectinata]|uniref:serine-rich adhesin for platelets-like n=1 Tax=Pristis pectinata TaxID=685728 RepID=UPI00223CCF70|nr:serine-rich adhesin for platelets-like [Pristis pectinata]